MNWISINERLPEPRKLVLVSLKSYTPQSKVITIAYHIPARTEQTRDGNEWSILDDYDEENDVYWVPEGFYERQRHMDYDQQILEGRVLGWMPLPEFIDTTITCTCHEYNGIISLCEHCMLKKREKMKETGVSQPLYQFLSTVTTYIYVGPHEAVYYAEVPYDRNEEFVNVIDVLINQNNFVYCEVVFRRKHLLVNINCIVGIENIKKYIHQNTDIRRTMLVLEERL